MSTSHPFLRDAQRRFIGALTALALVMTTPLARATVDDAHGFAMEAATPFVEQGFIVREDYWHGDVMSAQKLMVRHQLFKGNEYAFWLGTGNEDCKLDLQVLDEAGNAVHLDRKEDKNGMFVSVRVNPPKTGTYAVVFSVKSKREKSISWALAYGYR